MSDLTERLTLTFEPETQHVCVRLDDKPDYCESYRFIAIAGGGNEDEQLRIAEAAMRATRKALCDEADGLDAALDNACDAWAYEDNCTLPSARMDTDSGYRVDRPAAEFRRFFMAGGRAMAGGDSRLCDQIDAREQERTELTRLREEVEALRGASPFAGLPVDVAMQRDAALAPLSARCGPGGLDRLPGLRDDLTPHGRLEHAT